MEYIKESLDIGSKKKVLVTGGAGFIGSHVVDRLIDLDYDVLIIDNLRTGHIDNINRKAKFFSLDVTDTGKLREFFMKHNPDYVVHAAAHGYFRGSFEKPILDAKLNIIGSLNVIEGCREFKVKKLVVLSTSGIYSDPEYLPVDEGHPINPFSPYGLSKHTVERYLKLYSALYSLNFVAVRFANVYGPGSRMANHDIIPLFMKNILSNKKSEIFGDGNQTRDFIYVADVADAVISALERSTSSKFFNIGTEKQISIKDLYYKVREKLRSNVDPVFVEPKYREFTNIYLKNSRARDELGWNPRIDLDEGLDKTIKWYLKNVQNAL